MPCPAGAHSCSALVLYRGVGRELVARLKYRNARSSVGFLARGMAALAAEASGGFDVVTWAPTSPARRRQRGFDQGHVLARAVARRLGVPCRRLLWRQPGPAQTGRSLEARRRGPRFTVRATARVPHRVLVVDDVITSGATMASAAAALRTAGAGEVHVVVASHTPPPANMERS